MHPDPTLEKPLILVCDHRDGGGLARLGPLLEGAGHRVQFTGSLRETREHLAAIRPHVIVVDPLLDDARQELVEIQRLRGQPAVPLLLVIDPQDAVPVLESAFELRGLLHDLIRRDAPDAEFELRVACLAEQSVLERRVRELSFLATHDDRTGLLRPLSFEQRLAEHVSAAERHSFPLTVALLDLDRFGQLNKLYDHTIGDEVIAAVGSSIRGCLRREDVGGRIGGDEFAVLLPFTDATDASHVVERLLERIRGVSAHMNDLLPGAGLKVSASLGYDTRRGDDASGASRLRRNAELALRRAKQMGGDRALFFRNESAPSTLL